MSRSSEKNEEVTAVLEKPQPLPDEDLQRPNFLFFFVDQLRSHALSCYGETNIQTPNIDRLASEGVLFSNAIATCPVCTPSRGMFVTGRYATHSGVVVNFVNINPRAGSIADLFAHAGYRTGFIGKWHLNSGYHTDSGKHFAGLPEAQQRRARDRVHDLIQNHHETEFVPPGPQRMGFEYWAAYNFHMNFANAWYFRDSPEPLPMPRYETDHETDLAIEFMKQHISSPDPFFLAVAPHPPHPPWSEAQSPPGFLEKVKPHLDWRPNVPKEFDVRGGDPRAYFAMTSNIDDNIGRIMRFLDESGLAANTVVVFTSDHGEMLFSHNRTAKMAPYEESVSVPLIVRWAGHTPSRSRSDILYTWMDHMPTLLSLAGIEVLTEIDGIDLSPAILGRPACERDAALIANYVSDYNYFDSGTHFPEWRGVRTKTHTYVKWLDGKEELYDNLSDPYQMTNLAEDRHDLPTLREMRSTLKDLLAEAHDEFLPGTAYADWYDDRRNLIRTPLGPVR